MLPSDQANEREVHKEEEGEIECWSEEEWEQWEFVGEDDVEKGQEYEEDEEEDDDDDDDEEDDEEEEEEENGGGASVSTDLCYQTTQ